MRQVRISLVVLSALFVVPSMSLAQGKGAKKPGVDVGSLVSELMTLKLDGTKSQMALWLPYEFFVQVEISQGGEDPKAVESSMAFLKPYLAFAVVRSENLADGREKYATEKDIRSATILRLRDGTEIRPLDVVPANINMTLAAFKAGMAHQGSMEHAHILVFPSQTRDGKPIIDTTKRSKLTLVLKPNGEFPETSIVWYTPFDALTPSAPCSKCKEGLSAKWSYCPWCGAAIPVVRAGARTN
jgi:hypothetical protein